MQKLATPKAHLSRDDLTHRGAQLRHGRIQHRLDFAPTHVGGQLTGGDTLATVVEGQGITHHHSLGVDLYLLDFTHPGFALHLVERLDHRQVQIAEVAGDVGHIGGGQIAVEAQFKFAAAAVAVLRHGHNHIACAEQAIQRVLDVRTQRGGIVAVGNRRAELAFAACVNDRDLKIARGQILVNIQRPHLQRADFGTIETCTESHLISVNLTIHRDGAKITQDEIIGRGCR